MLLQESYRPADETDSADVEKRDATIGVGSCSSSSSSSNGTDKVQLFISAVSNSKSLAKPSYILMSDLKPIAEINT